MYKLAVFDMDGTILNTLAGLAASGNCALARAGFPEHEEGKYRFFVGNGIPKLIERILPENARDGETISRVMEYFNEDYSAHAVERMKRYPGLTEALMDLRSSGVKLAVASNKPPVYSRDYAERFFGKGFFECVTGPGEGVPPKPDPAMLLEAVSFCGILPKEACYFGDSAVDILTGINAGITTAGVAWGFRPESELLEAGARKVLHECHEILPFVLSRT